MGFQDHRASWGQRVCRAPMEQMEPQVFLVFLDSQGLEEQWERSELRVQSGPQDQHLNVLQENQDWRDHRGVRDPLDPQAVWV